MRAVLLAVSLLACSPAAAGPTKTLTVPIDVDEQDETTRALYKRLASDELEGLALVWPDAVLYPSADAARAGAPKRRAIGRGTRAVHILADEGDVVKVRTWLSPRVRPGMTALTSYDLTLYATRAQLAVVLREALREGFADGTGYIIRPGMPVIVGSPITPAASLGGDLEVAIPASKVSLSFPLRGKDEAVEGELGSELACERRRREYRSRGRYSPPPPPESIDEEKRTRVYPLKEHREELAAKRRERMQRERERREREREARGDDGILSAMGDTGMVLGMGGYEPPTCSLVSSYEDTEKNPAATVNGQFYARARDVGGDRCSYGVRVFRAPDKGQVLIDLDKGRVALRVALPVSALRATGGCAGIGTLGRGSRGRGQPPPPPPKILAARGKVKVYFPDGRAAGYHMEGVTKMRKTTTVGDRLCIEHDNVSTRLCFERDDLVEVDD